MRLPFHVRLSIDLKLNELFPEPQELMGYRVMSHLEKVQNDKCRSAYDGGYTQCYSDLSENIKQLQQINNILESHHKDTTKFNKDKEADK